MTAPQRTDAMGHKQKSDMTAGAEAPCRARHYGHGIERAILLWEMSDMVRVLADRETSQAIT